MITEDTIRETLAALGKTPKLLTKKLADMKKLASFVLSLNDVNERRKTNEIWRFPYSCV